MPLPPGAPDAWEVLLHLSAIFMGMIGRSTKDIDDVIFRQLAAVAVKTDCPWSGLTVDEVMGKLDGVIGPERLIDMLVRLGSYGDGFGRRPDGLTLAKVQASAHGIDLGPMRPRLREIINTRSGVIELAPPTMINDITRLQRRMAKSANGMVLIGRRHLRTSNSFIYNLPSLVKGRDHCTLQISRCDATRLGLVDGGSARITSRVGSIVAPVEVTENLMPGVVSLSHGWGHDVEESQLRVAKAHPGVNTNVLTDNQAYDAASGTAVLFGTPVSVEPLTAG